MGRGGFRPPCELVEGGPVADVVAQVEEVSVDVDIAYEAVAVAPDGRAVVAEEVHARLKSGQDFVQVEAALVCFRVGPVLPGPDQCDVVVSSHYARRSVV